MILKKGAYFSGIITCKDVPKCHPECGDFSFHIEIVIIRMPIKNIGALIINVNDLIYSVEPLSPMMNKANDIRLPNTSQTPAILRLNRDRKIAGSVEIGPNNIVAHDIHDSPSLNKNIALAAIQICHRPIAKPITTMLMIIVFLISIYPNFIFSTDIMITSFSDHLHSRDSAKSSRKLSITTGRPLGLNRGVYLGLISDTHRNQKT
jgi:hypothetical protein